MSTVHVGVSPVNSLLKKMRLVTKTILEGTLINLTLRHHHHHAIVKVCDITLLNESDHQLTSMHRASCGDVLP